MSKIFIVGMPASGKTTFGWKLACTLNYKFIDLDRYIERNEKKKINKIFNDSGESAFRELERFYLMRLKNETNSVISTGGGTCAFYDNMEWMNKNGLTIFLNTNIDILVQRNCFNKRFRPLFSLLSDKEIEQKMYFLLEKRKPYLLRSHLIINDSPKGVSGNVNDIQLVNAIEKIIY